MAVVGVGGLFLVDARPAEFDREPVLLADELCEFAVEKVVVGLADDVGPIRAE